MGCCVSTSSNRASTSSLNKDQDSVLGAPQPPRSCTSLEKASESRAPPPVEEETVKEVLSETPKWKPTIAKPEPEKPPQNMALKKPPQNMALKKPPQNMAFDKFEEGETKVEKALPLPINKTEEISEVSEVCSMSETMSTTTTITDQKEEGEEIRQRVNKSPAKMLKNRSFSGDHGGKRERTVGKTPSPRSVGSVRLVQSRDQMGQRICNGGMRNQPRRRDPGENSFRRSRSPATRTDSGAARPVAGRSPSARRTTRSPARVRAAAPENGRRKMESPTMEGKWPSANESLENPLVSLECFIFI